MYVTICMIYSYGLRVAGKKGIGQRAQGVGRNVYCGLRVFGRVSGCGKKCIKQRALRIVVREQKSEKGKVRWIGKRMFFTQSN